MSSSNEDKIQQLLGELTGALQLKLPLEHFGQFYDDHHFDNLAQMEAKKVLGNFQTSSKLNIQETLEVVNELFPRIQEAIEQWKVKNQENIIRCDQFLQSQVDFLITDFRTSVFIKLVSAPDVGVEELESFLERRKTVLIDIFDKLSKPGGPHSSVDMKTRLDENLECVKLETLEKQKHYLERKTTEDAQNVLEDSKVSIMKIATRLKSELNAYNGNEVKDLVKAKLIEISCFLSIEGKLLEKYHPNIYSAVLRTTAEVRKCLDDKDYQDMSAEEFAETLHEQLLFDFAGENHAVRSSCEMNLSLDSMSSENEVRGRNEISSEESEIQQCQQKELQIDFVDEEEMKEEKEDDMDHDLSGMDERDCDKTEAVSLQSGGGENREEDDEEKEDNASNMSNSPVYNNRRSARLQNPRNPVAVKHSKLKRQWNAAETKKSEDEDIRSESSAEDSTTDDDDENDPDFSLSEKAHKAVIVRSGDDEENSEEEEEDEVSLEERNARKQRKIHVDRSSNRRSARLQKSNNAVGPKHSKQKYRDTVAETEEVEDERSDSSDEHSNTDDNDEDDLDYSSSEEAQEHESFYSKPSGRNKLLRPRKRLLSDDKITYSHLNGGRPVYSCNVCNRKCFQNMLQYHGEHCGKKEMPYSCDECGMGFMRKQQLHNHERIHTGERPFECPKCSEKFAHPRTLTKHMQRHNHNRRSRFACKVCKRRFISQRSLHDHNKSMHKEKLGLGCRYCDNRFDNMKKLKTHVISHSEIRPFRCPSCDTSARSKYNLALHIEKCHSQPRQNAQRLADEAGIAYLIKETSNDSYRDMPKYKINSLVVSHIIKKANLKLP